MREKRLTGCAKVFSFTFCHIMKSKAIIVTFALMFLLAAVSLPAAAVLSGLESGITEQTSIDRLVILDETGLDMAQWLSLEDMEYDGALPETIEFGAQKDQELEEALADETEEAWAIIKISYDEEDYSFLVAGIYGTGNDVSESDLSDLTELIAENLQGQMTGYLGVSDEAIAYINHEVVTAVTDYSRDSEADDSEDDQENPDDAQDGDSLGETEYNLALTFLCVCIMLISLGGEQVAAAVLQEKSSRVVEFMLTSVKPLSLMVGKVFAVFAASAAGLAVVAAGAVFSVLGYTVLGFGGQMSVSELIASLFSEDGRALITQKPENIIVGIAVVMLGILLYTTMGALAGAGASRMEDLADCMKMYSLVQITGAYMGLAVLVADMTGQASDAFRTFVMLFPLSSPFLTPAYLIVGRASALTGLYALLFLLIAQALMFMFSANIYETLIYHKGSPLKLKDLFMINKKSRQEAGR